MRRRVRKQIKIWSANQKTNSYSHFKSLLHNNSSQKATLITNLANLVKENKYRISGQPQRIRVTPSGDYYKVRHRESKKDAALKYIKITHHISEQIAEEEARRLKKLVHQSVSRCKCHFYEVVAGEKYLVLQYDYYHTDLRQYLARSQQQSPAQIVKWIDQLLSAIFYFHSKNFIHGDVRLENCVLDGDCNLFLSDPRLTCELEAQYNQCEQFYAMSPEQFNGEFKQSSDVWGAGCIMYQLIFGCAPFSGNPFSIMKDVLEEKQVSFEKEIKHQQFTQLSEIIQKMLSFDFKQRPQINDVKKVFDEVANLVQNFQNYVNPLAPRHSQDSFSLTKGTKGFKFQAVDCESQILETEVLDRTQTLGSTVSLSFLDDELLNNKYVLEEIIGKGRFGECFLACFGEDNEQKCAIKRVIKPTDDEELACLRQESNIIRKLHCNHIVEGYESFDNTEQDFEQQENSVEYCYIVMKYYQHSSDGKIDNLINAPEQLRAKWMVQLLHSIGYLHSQKIIHRDLKVENCIIDQQYNLILCDFGTAIYEADLESSSLQQVGTYDTMAPEIIQLENYSNKVDVWSLGCIWYYFITGQYPFCNGHVVQNIINGKYERVDDPKFAIFLNLIEGMLKVDPRDRPSAAELLGSVDEKKYFKLQCNHGE